MTEPAEIPTTSAPTPPTSSARREDWLWAGLIVLLTLIVYQPALRGTFLWDDNRYAMFGLNAPLVHEPGGLAKIWFHPSTDRNTPDSFTTVQYYPLTFTAFWLQYQLWGLSTTGHHIVNVLLHAATALLLWQLLKMLRVPGAWVAGAVFAVHPIAVESVAWITELKNVLSGFFLLAAVYAYLRFAAPRETSELDGLPGESADVDWKWYAAAFALFACAVFSKTVTSFMPVVAALVLYWRFRPRLNLTTIVGLVPFLALGAALARKTAWMEKYVVGADGPDWHLTFVQRVLIAGHAFWFYIGKILLPVKLLFTYPRWDLGSPNVVDWLYVAAAVVVVGGSATWLLVGKRGRAVPVAILAYTALLFPAMGFFDVFPMRYSFVADHFQYHAGIAIIALLAGGITARVWRGEKAEGAQTVQAFAGVVIFALAILTWRQSSIYADPITLWQDTTARNPDAWMAHYNLGTELIGRAGAERAEGEAEKSVETLNAAIGHLEKCIALRPAHANAYNNWGVALMDRGRPADAIPRFIKSIELDPTKDEPHAALGRAYAQTGKPAEAKAEFHRAIAIDPNSAAAHVGLGTALASENKLPEAEASFRRAEQLRPEDASVQYELAKLLDRQSKSKDALPYAIRAARLSPENPEYLTTLGFIWGENGQPRQAYTAFDLALRIDPKNARAREGQATLVKAITDEEKRRAASRPSTTRTTTTRSATTPATNHAATGPAR